MSKRQVLRFLCVCFLPPLVLIGLYFGISGVSSLIEDNKELKVENTKIQRDSIQLQKQIDTLEGISKQQKKYMDKQDKRIKQQGKDIDSLKEQLKKSKNYNQLLQDTNKRLKDELNREKAKTVSQVPSRGKQPSGKSFYVQATAYIATCNEGCTGITATGINLLKNPGAKVIAVDPRIIPLGSKVYVEGYGYAVAGDTGGAIKGYKVDLLVPNTSVARQWGNRKVKLTILN